MSDIEIEGLTIVRGIEKLQEGFLFRGLSFEETRSLAGICALVNKRDGEIVVEEGAVGEDLYLVVSGTVVIVKGEWDDRRVLATLGPGETFGEMSLIDDQLTSASAIASGQTQLLKINKRDLERLMEGNDRLAARIYRSFSRVLSDRLRKAIEKG